LLDIAGKMKNGLNAHKDLQALGIREELHPQKDRMERFIFLQLTTPSQMRRKE
jgi:hypothetical protein